MADGILTLKERHALNMERMGRAILAIDAALTAYAREHGGRFIRYGSTANGRMARHSDVDIIADFLPHDGAVDAASFAETLCHEHGMIPDVRPATYVSDAFKAAAERDGVVLR